MKKILFSLITFITIALHTNAQEESSNYKNAVGIRLGSSVPAIGSGISIKHFLKDANAVEGILSFGGNGGMALCGLYEIHKPITSVTSLQWFYGGGAYVGFGSGTTSNFGAAGIVGLDYKFAQLPLNITLDWKPELNIVSKVGFQSSGVGISARFTF